MKHSFSEHHDPGFSTIEILIAFSVGIIFLTAAMMIAFSDASLTTQVSIDSGQASALDATLDNGGLYRAQNKLGDIVKSLSRDWNALAAHDSDGFFSNTPVVNDISPCMKEIVNATEWKSLNNRDRTITFGTALSDMKTAQALGPGGCDPTPPTAAWDSPKKYPNGVSVSSVNANDLVILAKNGKRFVVLGATPQGAGVGAAAFGDIYAYDLTDPANPSSVLGTLNTGKGINALATNGEYVFAVQNDNTNQLQVIRIFDTTKAPSDPLYYTPSLVTQVPLPGVGGAHPEGQAIAYYDKHVYVGTWNNNLPAGSPEFLIFDVSDPTNPIFTKGINLNHSINSIAISGTYAYLATTNDGGELMIIDIAHAYNPQVVSTFDIANANSNVDAEEVFVLGNKVFVGMDRNQNKGELIVINSANPLSPSFYSSVTLNLKSSTRVTGISVQGSYAFIGTDVSNEEFRVLNVSNPANPTMLPCSPYNYSAKVSSVKYKDGNVFVSNQANDALRVIYDTNGALCN